MSRGVVHGVAGGSPDGSTVSARSAPRGRVGGEVPVGERRPLVEFEGEQLAGREERQVTRGVGHPGRAERGLDPRSAEQVDQHVGRGVVAERDHLRGHVAYRDPGAVGLVLQLTGGEALDRRADCQLLVPADLVSCDRAAERVEDIQLERGTERGGRVGIDRVDRFARSGGDLAHEQANLRCDGTQRGIDCRPGRRRRRELHDRAQQQAADQSAVVNGEVDAQLGVAADGDDRDERARLVHVDGGQLRVGGRLECLIDRGRVHLREKRTVEMGTHAGVGDRQAAERREQPPSLRARRRMGQRRRRGRRRRCPFGCARGRGRVPAARARRKNRAHENARSRQLEPTKPHARSVSVPTTSGSPRVCRPNVPLMRWILVGTAAIWVALELRQSITHRPEGVRAGWRSEVLFRVVVAVGAIGAGVASRAWRRRRRSVRPTVVDWIGLVVFWGGISLRLWSFHTLGRYFTFTVQTSREQPVITDGAVSADPAPRLCRVAPRHHRGGPVHRELVVARVSRCRDSPAAWCSVIRVEEQALTRNLGGELSRLCRDAQTPGAVRLVTGLGARRHSPRRVSCSPGASIARSASTRSSVISAASISVSDSVAPASRWS